MVVVVVEEEAEEAKEAEEAEEEEFFTRQEPLRRRRTVRASGRPRVLLSGALELGFLCLTGTAGPNIGVPLW